MIYLEKGPIGWSPFHTTCTFTFYMSQAFYVPYLMIKKSVSVGAYMHVHMEKQFSLIQRVPIVVFNQMFLTIIQFRSNNLLYFTAYNITKYTMLNFENLCKWSHTTATYGTGIMSAKVLASWLWLGKNTSDL